MVMIVTVSVYGWDDKTVWRVRERHTYDTVSTYYSFWSVCDRIYAWDGPVRFRASAKLERLTKVRKVTTP